MKHVSSLILTLLLVTTLFYQNGFAQEYVHYNTLYRGTYDDVYSVSFNPDRTILATSGQDKTIRLWDVFTGNLEKTLTGHTGVVHSLSFSPDGLTLVSGSGDRTIRFWDVNTGRHFHTLTGHEGSVRSIAFSPDGQTLATGSPDNTIRFQNVSKSRHSFTLIGHKWGIYSVAFSPDGRTLASGSGDGTIQIWNVGTSKQIRTFVGHESSVWRVVFSPDGQTLVSGSADNTIRFWDVSTGEHLGTLTGHTDDVISIVFSPDGQTLVSGSKDKTVRLWRVSSPRTTKSASATPPKPNANQVYEKAIRAVMWIVNPGIGEGSGVLIDKKSKLAITNAHVTGKQNTIDVYFPAPDEKGELIKDRNFYLTSGGVLKRLGYYTKGHVIAKNEKTDLAIIKLDGLPETARQIDWKLTPPTTEAGELVYVLGNPAKQELWRWTPGEFLNDRGEFLHIQSDVFGGNSGGPVLNKQGILIGIVARSDQLMNAAAIPMRHIHQLLSDSKVKHSRLHR
jgi:WD40 repeat protein